MRSPATMVFAALVSIAVLAPAASGCVGGEDCFQVTVCKFVDLLAACEAAAGCAHAGLVELLPGDVLDPTAVQSHSFEDLTTAKMHSDSAVTVPVLADAAVQAAVPLLDVVVELSSGSTDQVSVLVDGAPFATCVPTTTLAGTSETAEWKCPLPGGTQTVEIAVSDAIVTSASMSLTEPTCTGSAQRCAL